MAFLVATEDAVITLSQNLLPDGVTPNPFALHLAALDRTRGSWSDQESFKGGRTALVNKIEVQGGIVITNKRLYTSPSFSRYDIFTPIAVAGALQIFSLIGEYGEVIDYPAFIEIDDATAQTTDVPAFVPNNSYTNEQEEIVVRKWADWHDDRHEHLVVGETRYIELAGFGVSVAGSVIAQLIGSGYVVKSTQDWPVISEGE